MEKTIEVVNVIVMLSGIIDSVKSFVIINEENKEEIVKQAEDYFIEQIEEQVGELCEDDRELYINEGTFDENGFEVHLIWS